jgi:drug/metabolite transporter (DMT)-like permease
LEEWIGVGFAAASSALGGSAAAITRYLAVGADPIAIAVIRFGLGFLLVLPIAVGTRVRWPPPGDWLGIASLGILFFAVAIVLYNIALSYTTAVRATLVLSTLPFVTMVVGALLGVEHTSTRKVMGVIVAMFGVSIALVTGAVNAPPGAWRGELLMLGTSVCMSLYNVWSRPFIDRSSALAFLTIGMGAGAIALVVAGFFVSDMRQVVEFISTKWIASLYLSVGGGALAFVLWILAFQCTTPTRVAVTITLNPISAALLATVLLNEPITWTLIVGLLAILVGIGIVASSSVPQSKVTDLRNRDHP